MEIPLADFLTGTPRVVDLSRLSQIVFAAETTTLKPVSYEMSLVVDNVEIFRKASRVVT